MKREDIERLVIEKLKDFNPDNSLKNCVIDTINQAIEVSDILDLGLYKNSISYFGKLNQILKIAEECSELSAILVKYVGELNKASSIDYEIMLSNIYQEIADVNIVMRYAPLLFDNESIEKAEELKLERLRRKIEIINK